MQFSSFLELKHTDANGLLQYLTETHSIQQTALGAGVPFHLWPNVWADWPGKASHGQVWQECFHWCDGNHDGLIVQSELEQCFLLSRTHDMVDTFCADLCHTYPSENALCATWANGAETILAGRWDSLWNSDSKVSSKGVSSANSFRYVDKDGSGAITKTEFKSCYSTGNCGHSWPLIGSILQGAGATAGAANMAGAQLKAHHHEESKAKQEEKTEPAAKTSSKADATTALDESVSAGAEILPCSNTGFQVGREIVIDAENPAITEVNVVTGFGSLVLQNPLVYEHAAGISITMREAVCTTPGHTGGVESWSPAECNAGGGFTQVPAGTDCQITPSCGYTCTSPGLCGTDGNYAATAVCEQQTCTDVTCTTSGWVRKISGTDATPRGCDPESACCEATCATFSCPSGYNAVNQASTTVDQSTCCQATCAAYSCPNDYESNPDNSASTTFDQSTCCQAIVRYFSITSGRCSDTGGQPITVQSECELAATSIGFTPTNYAIYTCAEHPNVCNNARPQGCFKEGTWLEVFPDSTGECFFWGPSTTSTACYCKTA